MAKSDEVTYEDLSRMNHELKGSITSLASKVGKREDGESSFHDSVKIEATMGSVLLHEILDAMGMENTTFIDNLPDEAPQIELLSSFQDHTVKIKTSGKAVASMDGVTIQSFVVKRIDDTQFRMNFIIKGVPTLNEHFNLEKCRLDCHAGKLFMIAIGSPPQEEMFGGDDDEEPAGASESRLTIV